MNHFQHHDGGFEHQQQQQQHQQQQSQHQHQHPQKWHSFKVLVDPTIHRGAPKMVRYDGAVVPGDPHHVPPNPSDPRNRLPTTLWKRLEPMELPVPKFKVDENYVGDPPKVEVTVENLNDNVDSQFLHNLVIKFGTYEELCIHFHPVTRKHLGLARIVFEEVKSAKECVRQMHGKSVMGQSLNCYIDPRGASCRKMYIELTEEQPKPEPVVVPVVPVLPPPPPFQPEIPPPIPSGRTASLDDSPDDKLLSDKRASTSHWDQHDVSSDPRHISRRRDSAAGRRPEYSSSRDRDSDRWSSRERDRDRDRHHRRDESGSDRGDRHSKSRHGYQDDISYKSGSAHQPQFDPNYAQPDFWQQAAQQYARQQAVASLPPPPVHPDQLSESPTNQEEEVVEDSTVEETRPADTQVIDLDTRLKMLMKDKTGAMPAFLLQELNSGSDESDKETSTDKKSKSKVVDAKDDDDPDAPLSRPPSPFLSAEHYYANLKNRTKKKSGMGSRNSKSGNRPSSQNSDRMSLSSLSSGENNLLHEATLPPPPQPDPYYGYYAQPPLPGQPPPPPPGFPGPPTNGWNGIYPPPHPHYPVGNYGHPSFPPGFMPHPHFAGWSAGGWQGPEEDPYSGYFVTPKKSDKSAFRPVISETVRVFVKELKRALIKDIQKRMCESYAFYLYEQWWTDQDKKYKDRMAREFGPKKTSSSIVPPVGVPPTPLIVLPSSSNNKENTSANVSSEVANVIKQLPRIPKAEDLSTLFDQQRVNIQANRGLAGGSFGAGGSLGFGFRGTIPKLPSFKRKTNATAVTSRRDRPSTSRRSDGLSSDDDSKQRRRPSTTSSSGRRRTTSERRREHEQRREERLGSGTGKDGKRKNDVKLSLTTKDDSKTRKDKLKLSEHHKASLDEESSSKLSSKTSSPVPPETTSRKTTSQSSSDNEISETSQVKSPVDGKSRRRRAKVVKKSSSEKDISSGDESSTSVRSSIVESSAESSSSESKEDESERETEKTKKVVERRKDKKRTSSSISEMSESSSSSSSGSSSSSSSSASEAEEEKSASSSSEEVEVETRKKKRPIPVRRPSVAVKSDEIPNGSEIRDLVDIVDKDVDVVERDVVVDDDARIESPAYMTDHCYARPVEEKKKEFESQFANDHGYSRPRTPTKPATIQELGPAELPTVPLPKKEIFPSVRPKAIKTVEPPKPKPKPQKVVQYSERTTHEEYDILFRFLKGLDIEDVRYFQISYQMMLKREEMSKLLNYTHWVDHPVAADVPPAKRRKSDNDFSKPHLTGSCRTEGYYKMDPREKRRTKYHLQRPEAYEALSQQYRLASTEGSVTKAKGQTSQSQSREARNNQRRQLAVLGDEAVYSDLLKFNQLKFRRKQLCFGKSAIHDWGLFAREDIGADEMVIEYVGHVIRPLIADVREKRYEKQGIGSSYLFRIDQDYVVDATKCGNLARFINHSCDPNCYAKIITIDGEKKIVIYSKQPIAFGEEITYDYKFPIEDEKIHCLCGAKNCRKYLN